MKIPSENLDRIMKITRALTIALLTMASPSWAANHYIRAGATGTGTGNDWINAYTDIPATLIRGDTYYIAGGNYGKHTFNSIAGTSYVYLKKATAAECGAVNGWQASYESNQAVFTAVSGTVWTISLSYLSVDGVTGSGINSSSYGIKLVQGSDGSQDDCIGTYGGKQSYLKLQHVELQCPYPDGSAAGLPFNEKGMVYGGGLSVGQFIQNCYLHGGLVGMCFTGDGVTDQGIIIDHCYLRSFAGQEHSEVFQLADTKNVTIRYCDVADLLYPSTTYIEPQSYGTIRVNGIYVYGNVFWAATAAEGNNNAGVLSMTGVENCDNVLIYNNTFYGMHGPSGVSGGNVSGSTGIIVQNNLWQACVYTPTFAYVQTQDHNILNTGVARFVNTVMGDFRLATNTPTAGVMLGSPYNLDPNGNVRGADGWWDIGAFEFGGTNIVVPPPPPETILPMANNDSYSMAQGTTLSIASANGVLSNDTGSNLTAIISSGPSNGTLNLSANGGFSYTPTTNFTGTVNFSYRASNGVTNSGLGVAGITVVPSGALFSDDFSRTALSPWNSVLGTWSLVNGTLQGIAGSGAYGYLCLATNWTDYSIEGRIQFSSDAYGGGLGGRVNPTTGAHYGAWVYPVNGGNVIKLIKFSAWTSWSGTPMQQVSLPAVGTNSHSLKLVFQSTRIQVYYDGSVLLDVTDTGFDGTSPFLSGGISVDLSQGTIIADNILVSSLISPALSLTPTSQSFGSIPVGTTTDRSFTVQNSGGGTLSGSASAVAPFSILSGSPYSLGAGLSQTVTVRYSPTTIGSNSQGISFTGGSGAIATATGSAWLPPVVSAITQNGLDVNLSKSGLQVFAGSVVQYSGTASDPNGYPLTWQWLYTTNGSETVVQSGSGTVSSINFNYMSAAAGSTFIWKLRVSNGVSSTESTLAVGVEAPPPPVEGLTFLSGSGVITAPFVYTNSSISQPLQTFDPALGGRATYSFTITYPGNYILQGLVNAPNIGANSFFLNIDAEPEDPTMIWDIPTTSNFEQRVISWRGNGSEANNQYIPKIFALTQGVHQVIIRCREADVQLKSFVILQLPPAPRNLRIVSP
jgi:hypothetical protein